MPPPLHPAPRTGKHSPSHQPPRCAGVPWAHRVCASSGLYRTCPSMEPDTQQVPNADRFTSVIFLRLHQVPASFNNAGKSRFPQWPLIISSTGRALRHLWDLFTSRWGSYPAALTTDLSHRRQYVLEIFPCELLRNYMALFISLLLFAL